jgi:DNA-binding IclR family transcriptional regulator
MTAIPPGLEILNKAFAVVTVLETGGELAVARVAELVGEPVSSTYRILTSLMQIGWVDRGSQRGLYRLGMAFLRVGGMVEEQLDLRERVMPYLQELRAGSGATSYLCIRRGTSAVCVERLDGEGVRAMSLQVGDSLPLDVGAAPLVLLSYLPVGERSAVAAALAVEGSTPTDELLALAAQVRAKGFAVSDGDVTPGVAAVGAPVFNHRGEIEAAISISGLRSQIMESSAFGPSEVVKLAMAASAALGFRKAVDDV